MPLRSYARLFVFPWRFLRVYRHARRENSTGRLRLWLWRMVALLRLGLVLPVLLLFLRQQFLLFRVFLLQLLRLLLMLLLD